PSASTCSDYLSAAGDSTSASTTLLASCRRSEATIRPYQQHPAERGTPGTIAAPANRARPGARGRRDRHRDPGSAAPPQPHLEHSRRELPPASTTALNQS